MDMSRRKRQGRAPLPAALGLFLLLLSRGSGQETVFRGLVKDNQGQPLPKVKITLVDPTRGTRFSLSSNKAGEFTKVGVPAATYNASFELDGYFRFETRVSLMPGNEEKVLITLQRIPPKIDDDPDFAAGIDLFKGGRYEEAISLFQKVAAQFPDNVEPFYNLGVSYLRSGNPEKAIAALERAVQLKPDALEAYFALGECYFNLGQADKAMEAFSKATDIEPGSAKAYYNLGIIYYKNNETDQAIRFFEQAIALDPKFPSAYYQAGLANIKKGDYQKAIKHFEDFIKLEPDSADAGRARAIIEELRKK
jgi:tetratricopeptide (TPR) repeat protein